MDKIRLVFPRLLQILAPLSGGGIIYPQSDYAVHPDAAFPVCKQRKLELLSRRKLGRNVIVHPLQLQIGGTDAHQLSRIVHEQDAFPAFCYRTDSGIGKPMFLKRDEPGPFPAAIAVKPFTGYGNPGTPLLVGIDAFRHSAASQALHEARDVTIKHILLFVKQIVSVTAFHPHQPVRAFRDFFHIIVGQRKGIAAQMPVHLERVSVKTVQTGACPEPHESVSVLIDGIDRIVGKPVGHLQMLEHERLGRYGDTCQQRHDKGKQSVHFAFFLVCMTKKRKSCFPHK